MTTPTATPVSAAVDFWRQQMELHKTRADNAETALAAARRELDESKANSRKYRNQAHTWRLLYDGLLEKVARKLDIEPQKNDQGE